ncbi:MAG: hypothetical protein JWL59_2092 [Chthoniobacteraceae bacterium]|nr:hypothetical protein [Chthoniobacteraceae bacterium]
MKPRTAALIFLGILLCLTIEVIYKIRHADDPVPDEVPAASEPATPSPQAPRATALPSITGSLSLPNPAQLPASPLYARITALLEKLRHGGASSLDLAQLADELSAADKRQAFSAILDFLSTGQDASTGAEFTIGENGRLAGAPTLRVMLMDLLGRFSDQTGGAEAATLARTVLETKDSADEWAVSLRNIARHEPQSVPYLAGKMQELLSNAPWLTKPSAGMLEAFDVAVFTKDPKLIPPLAAMIGGENQPLRRAAAVALDRLSEAAPLQVMTYLNQNPRVMADHPFIRADYFSKADLADPQQRQAVELYISRPDVALEEKTKLLKGLVAPASFVSENLLTQPPPPVDDAVRLATVEKTTGEWLKSNRFPQLQPELIRLQSHLGR